LQKILASPVLFSLSKSSLSGISWSAGWNTVFGPGVYALAYHLWHARVHYLVLVDPCNIIAITNAYVCYKLLCFAR